MQGLDIVTGFRTVMDLLPLYSFPGRPKLHLTQRQARCASERLQYKYNIIHGSWCKLQSSADKRWHPPKARGNEHC